MSHRKKLLFLSVCMMLIACQARVEGLSTPDQALTIQKTVNSPQSIPLPTELKAKTSTPVQTAMMPSTPAATHSSTPSKTAEPTLPPDLPTVESIQDCSTPLKLVSSGVVPEGSIIMVVWSDETRNWQIWAYSSKSGTPRMLKEIPDPSYNFRISPDGTQIGWVRAIDYARELVVHDFITGGEQHYSPNVPWLIFSGWIDQEHVKLYKDSPERQTRIGFTDVAYQFDLSTQEITTITETVDLPGYSFTEDGIVPKLDSFASITPDGKLGLYTAFGENGTDIVLRDLGHQQDVWRRSLKGYSSIAYPSWSSDGQTAALAYWTKGYSEENYLFQLSRQGDIKPLVRLAPFMAYRIISWSPNNRFLHYVLESESHKKDGPGYLLDTLTDKNKQICIPGETLFYMIDWVDKEDLLAFAVGLDSGKSQLVLMDPEKWEGQILMEGSDMAYIPFAYGLVGLTPLDLP